MKRWRVSKREPDPAATLMTASSPVTARLVIPSDPHRIAEADEFLEGTLREHGVPDSLVTDLAIAATELVNNAIIHGNKENLSKTVTLTVTISGDEVEIRVADQGDGFHPNEVPSPLAEENLLKEVGRGIFIVRSLMDEVEYEQVPGKGSVVVARKSLTSE
ncbi:MAG TPA: ATP-binding protein [Acidobacteriota bacterium]|nr:ATP-binding protein [Acidobacteriota bacterium]